MLRGEAYGLKQLEPVGVQRRVEDEDVGGERRQLCAHLAHRPSPTHFVTDALEALDDGSRHGRLVLGEQDACMSRRHRPPILVP